MITGELKNKVDKIWEIFWTGGITNPLEVIEQFNYLLFIKQLDEVETRKERDANILGIPYEGIFPVDCQLSNRCPAASSVSGLRAGSNQQRKPSTAPSPVILRP